MGNRTEELSQGAVLGNPSAVSAGMYHEDPQSVKGAFLFPQVFQYGKCRSSGADPYSSLVRDHFKNGLFRQILLPCFDLQPEAPRLMFIGCGQYHIIPYRKSRSSETPLIIAPCILI